MSKITLMHRRLTFVAAAVFACAGTAGVAIADQSAATSVAELSWTDSEHDADVFDGKLKSTDDRCKKNRHVLLFRQVQGSDPRVEDTRSLTGGVIILEVEDPGSGRYYVKVRPKQIANVDCERAKSGVLTITDLEGV